MLESIQLQKASAIQSVVLTKGTLQVTVTNVGAAVMRIMAPDKDGLAGNVVAGYEQPEDYLNNPHYLGCAIGRYANRIAGGMFQKEGRTFFTRPNHGEHLLHGGAKGFHNKVWNVAHVEDNKPYAAVTLSYDSPDGEEGFPGNLKTEVRYALYTDDRLEIRYRAESDQDTPVNFTNHSYFNLSGFLQREIYRHSLKIYSETHTEKSSANVPSGRVVPNAGTALDFLLPKYLGSDIHSLEKDQGYDHNFVLKKNAPPMPELAAVLYEPESGRHLKVYTDRPGIQLYTANAWDGALKGAHELPYRKHGALALETQAFPDSVNHPHFPDTWLKAGEVFRSTTIYAFGLGNPF